MEFLKNILSPLKSSTKYKKLGSKNFLRKGFTLLEIMIVLVILGTLITIFIVSIDTGDEEQMKLHSLTSRSQIKTALLRFRQACGRYPTENEGLAVLAGTIVPENEDCSQKKYVLNKNLLKDYYKNDYVYSISEDGQYQIISLGADGKEGGEGKNADVDINTLE